jgi:hypothetical protein
VLNANTIKNTLDGTTNGKATYVTKEDGTLRGEPDGKGPSGFIHVVRTGITNTITGGSASNGKSALDIAQSGDIIHLTNGATYAEAVTLTKSVDFAVPSPNSTPTTATLNTLTLEEGYTVKIPSGETPSGETPLGELVVGSRLTLDKGSTLDGNPIVLGSGASLTDNGLASGSIKATRTVGVGETVNFGNIGLTLAENSGNKTPGSVTVTRVDGNPETKGGGSIERYYDVTAAQESDINVNLTLAYDDGSNGGDNELDENSLTESNLAIFRSDDNGGTWSELAVASANASGNTLSTENLSSFSRFTAAASGSTLPVELSQFDAVAEDGTAILRWSTASETNNSGFRVQRKTETGFETLQFVEGAGTTSQPTDYRVQLSDLEYGAHTFRLEQVDRDGSTSLSAPVTIQLGMEGRFEVSRVAPNPAVHQSQIDIAVKRGQKVQVALFDALGRRVRTLHTGQMPGEKTHQFTVHTKGLSSGAYFLNVQGERFGTTRRFTVVR